MLWLVHPAFQLSNPFVILLAFIIIALAVLVMSIISGRFNEQMKKLRTEVAVIHDTDVSRSSASLTAFELGISNMKRRKTRTVLTFTTLLLLTFTVLSFTSIRTGLRFNQISRDNEGPLRGHPHPQQGVESNGGFSPRIRPQQFRRSGRGRAAQLVQQ